MAKTNYLSRSDILEAEDLQIKEIEIPEWGGTIRVRGLTGTQRDEYLSSLLVNPGVSADLKLANATAKLVYQCVVDKEGKPAFREGDILLLGKKNGHALNQVYELASELSGLETKDIEKITQSLESGQNGDSTSS